MRPGRCGGKVDRLFKGFFKDKKVLITGHTGFKGSWLALWLTELGAKVQGYALEPSSSPNMFSLCGLERRLDSHFADVRDIRILQSLMDKFKPEIIFHLAAQSLVRRSYRDPVETYEINVMGTVNVLEACRHSSSVRVVINVTSDKCYENKEWIWGYREDDPMGGYDPYSSSKGCSELITSAYRRSYFNKNNFDVHHHALSSARAGNVIGGGDWAEDRLIPDCVGSLASNERVQIRNPHATRPWQFVLEPLRGYMTLCERMWESGEKFSGAWNFGPSEDSASPVGTVVGKIFDLWDGVTKQISYGEEADSHHEARFLKLNISKVQSLLGWDPAIELDDALRMTISWYKHYYDGNRDMTDFTLQQIEKYSKLVLERLDDEQK